jgi:hypothetical protein
MESKVGAGVHAINALSCQWNYLINVTNLKELQCPAPANLSRSLTTRRPKEDQDLVC